MAFDTVSCACCETPLHISEKMRKVACPICDHRLVVQRDGLNVSTELLGPAHRAQRIPRSPEIEQFDRDWQEEWLSYHSNRRDQNRFGMIPRKHHALLPILFFVPILAVILWNLIQRPSLDLLLGLLLFIAFTVAMSMIRYLRAEKLEERTRLYRRIRRRLIQRERRRLRIQAKREKLK